MTLLIVSPGRETSSWVKAIRAVDPEIPVAVYPEAIENDKVSFVLAWKHPMGILKQYPNVKAILSMGAGVDFLFDDPEIPWHIPIARIVDPELSKTMFEFVLAMIMNHLRGLTAYKKQQTEGAWNPKLYKRIQDVRVGIMGVGEIGRYVAAQLKQMGFAVHAWAQSVKPDCSIKVYAGSENLDAFLNETDMLVCLLPATKQTRGLLNKQILAKLPEGASLINVARGSILVEEDLLELINSGHLSRASLDVFSQEPLPKEHPFWKHSKIDITPHVASITNPKTVASQLVENYHRAMRGEALLHAVSREKGY